MLSWGIGFGAIEAVCSHLLKQNDRRAFARTGRENSSMWVVLKTMGFWL